MPGNNNSNDFTTPTPSSKRPAPNVTGDYVPLVRQLWRFDSEGRPTITPTQVSSIRNTARWASKGGASGNAQRFTTFDLDRKGRAQEYDFADAIASRKLSLSPNVKTDGSTEATASAPKDNSSTHKDDAPTDTEKERFCYGDTTEKQARDDDEWLECGGCKGWFHL